MATWDSYTQKSTPADADTLMIKDTSGGANKRTPFSGVWNWILTKLTNAVISQLETTNKSIIPAINELNSKTSVYATSKQNFLDLGTKLRAGFSYPIYLSAAAIQEITNGEYTITAKGIVYVGSGSQMDIMVMIGSGDVILTGRVYLDQDPLLYKINTEKIV